MSRVPPAVGATAAVVPLLLTVLLASTPVPPTPSVGVLGLPEGHPLGAPVPNPYSTGMPASLAVGEVSLSASYPGHGPRNLTLPTLGAAFNASGNLWVTDTGDNRLLEYVPPFSTGMNATVSVGQTSLSGWKANTTRNGVWEPEGLAFDQSGDLWVADSTNNRVLEFIPPFRTGMNASLVLGQPGFVTRGTGTSNTSFTHPTGLAFGVSGDLFVADDINNRVLVFTPPFTSGMAASYVIGQATFTASGPGTSATNLSGPTDVAEAPSGAIWVVDGGNNRVVEYAPPFSNGMPAIAVIGQKNLTLRTQGPPYGLSTPFGLAFDAGGDLWVVDHGNNRALEYLAPLVTNETPAVVLGQSNFSGKERGTTPVNLTDPSVPAVGPTGDLWVVDDGDSRVVEYVPSEFAITVAETGLPNGTAWSVTLGGVTKVGVAAGTLTFLEWNGSYPFSAGLVPGYSASPASGTEPVNGRPVSLTIAYATTSSSSSSSTALLDFLWILFLIIAVVLLILYLTERRRRRASRAQAPSGWSPPSATGPSAPPPGGPLPPSSGG